MRPIIARDRMTDMFESMTEWTNERAIARWDRIPRDVLADTAGDGDFSKRHLINPVLLRLLGDVAGQRVLDAGCGNGYLSRMLARLGASVTGVEPAGALLTFCLEAERADALGISYRQADLCDVPGLTSLGEFDAVVASMVLPAIPDWTGALAGCASRLRPGGRLIFTVNHPCFEQLARTWARSTRTCTCPIS
jgi:2-polyprenyl-3-methyl-5-hydroxy-6-metoxy-1,4-benzoquinol methylase